MSSTSYAVAIGLKIWPMGRNEEARLVAAWLNSKFLEWAQLEGSRKTIRDFADYLTVSEIFLGKWMRGERAPRNEHVVILGNKLGADIYKLVGWPVPEISRSDPARKTSRSPR